MSYNYRGIPCLKSPLDISIYLRLLHDCRPVSIIEIGSKHGGSALLLRDFGRTIVGPEVHVTSIDIKPPDIQLEGVTFLEGDVLDLGSVFSRHGLERLPRPWLVIEDSAHTAAGCRAALDFFAARLHEGEVLAMEDGILADLGMAGRYGGGPNRAIADFLTEHPEVYRIASRYCDMFGPNATYNPNGYLERTGIKFP